MNDFIWFIMTGVLFFFLGIVFILLGRQIRTKQRTDLIISWHSDKVREENRHAYCTLFGTGILIMGAGFLLSGICIVFTQSAAVFVPMAAGLASGIIMLVTAVMKYNR